MVKKIDHLGIAVKNLAAAIERYESILGLACSGIEEIEEQKVRVAMIPVGAVNIELLESTEPNGPVGRFIERKGEGFHHMAFRVSDIDKEVVRLKGKNVRLINEEPRIGAHGARIVFIHPGSMNGVLVELVERN
jgi:methylmalonyl-CoA epimerase